jgi:hypothetical protein
MDKLTKEQITKIINEHIEEGTTLYSVQYHDYAPNVWTAPVLLNKKRAEQILEDNSVRTVKLFYGYSVLVLVL